jgi:hypothetical protein
MDFPFGPKRDEVRTNGEPHHAAGFAPAPDAVSLRDEFPERQSFPLANSPHGLKYASDCDQ